MDFEKLSKEDRRFLMNLNHSSITWNSGIVLAVMSAFFSLLAILIALFSLLYSIEEGFTKIVKIIGITYVLLLIIAIFLYFKYKNKFLNVIYSNNKEFQRIFKIHFKKFQKK